MLRPTLRRRAFTLVEVLVVIIIIGILIAMLLPAVNAAREAARASGSANNLRQIAIGGANFEARNGHMPPSWKAPTIKTGANVDGWSIFALLLPYIEQNVLSSQIDYTLNYNSIGDVVTADGDSIRLSAVRVPVYISPGEKRDEVRIESGVERHYPFNYAVNVGTFLVWDPTTATGGAGVAYPDSKIKTAQIRDGLSMTMSFAEVKGWQPYLRNRANTAAALNALDPAVIHATTPTTVSNSPSALPLHADFAGGESLKLTGHTEWVDGRCHHSGFTTALTPNSKVLFVNSGTGGDGKTYDIDWNNWQEGKNAGPTSTGAVSPTYAVVTARSYFEGGVHVAMCDGSVKWVNNNINLGVWRAYGTRDGQDIIPSKEQL